MKIKRIAISINVSGLVTAIRLFMRMLRRR